MQPTCSDTDGGATDDDGYGCGDYYSGYCGFYDDSDFTSNDMCCVCGGGVGGDLFFDYSDESGGVCAIADVSAGGDGIEVPVTLTEHDDCFVVVVATGVVPKLRGLGGNDVLCGGSGNDYRFYGMHQ